LKNPVLNNLFGVREDDGTQTARDCVHVDAQSVSFYCDISAFVRDRLVGTMSLLDIGPRTGAGLAVLRLLHHPMSYSAIKFDPVTGIDIDPMFEQIAKDRYPDIEALTGVAENLSGKWDIVISSHTIEHVDDPDAFLNMMKTLARKAVVIAAPFEEQDLIVWHKQRITYKLLTNHGFHDMRVYRSNHFFNSLCVIAMKTA
jgi:2-polyprenyl-3-methyl-5-hydroxy-6-metoxy-1,4-benzoquinol methylase